MTFTGVLANLAVTDLDRSRAWYAVLTGREPDATPMEGLLEWRLGADVDDPIGFQLFSEPERAGQGGVVLHAPTVAALDAARARLHAAGIAHQEPFDATESQVLVLADPDGNRVVIGAPFAG